MRIKSLLISILAALASYGSVYGADGDFTVSTPAGATFALNTKTTHFVDFTPVEPVSVETEGTTTTYTYSLTGGKVYNYRTSMTGKLTQAGYFTMNTDETKRPLLNFTETDYEGDPAMINHSPEANNGYETGDIFVNINPSGHLHLAAGERFSAHAMRSWELTDNVVGNYFIEPDFHYTILDIDGNPSEGVVKATSKDGSAWTQLEGVAAGDAIVLVTYDAIRLNYYSGATKKPYLGDELWGAIWPENTAVYVVSVGQDKSSVKPDMVINEEYNKEATKMSGKYVDSEHDIFYYLDTEDGFNYTFSPEGATEICIAYPTIGERMITFSGFGNEGVTRNDDGSYTLLLKHGRQIVRMTDAYGNNSYQVLTARKCHREIANCSRPEADTFLPGDVVKIQYSGLFHPANKLAGIYNMSAYITYNDTPNGSSLILGKGQYTFGSAAAAQSVTFTIPEDHDVTAEPIIALRRGVIQVNGYGDPIGNHRNIDPAAGRTPNFTAVAHKTYCCALPDVVLNLDQSLSANDIAEDNQAEIEAYYNTQGLRSATPFKGVNIVRMTNGTVRKIIIR